MTTSLQSDKEDEDEENTVIKNGKQILDKL